MFCATRATVPLTKETTYAALPNSSSTSAVKCRPMTLVTLSWLTRFCQRSIQRASNAAENRQVGNAVHITIARRKRDVEREPAARHGRRHSRIHVLAKITSHPARNAIKLLPVELHQIAVISREQLISAIARERHGHILPRHVGDVVGWHHRRIAEWLFQHPCEEVQRLVDVRLDN